MQNVVIFSIVKFASEYFCRSYLFFYLWTNQFVFVKLLLLPIGKLLYFSIPGHSLHHRIELVFFSNPKSFHFFVPSTESISSHKSVILLKWSSVHRVLVNCGTNGAMYGCWHGNVNVACTNISCTCMIWNVFVNSAGTTGEREWVLGWSWNDVTYLVHATNFQILFLFFNRQFLKFMNHKKSRLTDLFRKMDKDNNGLIPRDIFVDGIINTSMNSRHGSPELDGALIFFTSIFLYRIRYVTLGNGCRCRSFRSQWWRSDRLARIYCSTSSRLART